MIWDRTHKCYCNFTISPFVLGFSVLAFQPHACNDGYLDIIIHNIIQTKVILLKIKGISKCQPNLNAKMRIHFADFGLSFSRECLPSPLFTKIVFVIQILTIYLARETKESFVSRTNAHGLAHGLDWRQRELRYSYNGGLLYNEQRF